MATKSQELLKKIGYYGDEAEEAVFQGPSTKSTRLLQKIGYQPPKNPVAPIAPKPVAPMVPDITIEERQRIAQEQAAAAELEAKRARAAADVQQAAQIPGLYTNAMGAGGGQRLRQAREVLEPTREERMAELQKATQATDFGETESRDNLVEEIFSQGKSGIQAYRPLDAAGEMWDIRNETRDRSILTMTDEERAIYAYHAAKNPKSAEAYLDALMPELETRYAQEMAQQGQGNIGSALVTGIASGAASGVEGIGKWFSGNPEEQSIFEKTQQAYQRANQGTAAGVVGDLSYSVGNMLPSIFAAGMTGGASLASGLTMGMGSGGNAYAQARREGYDDWQALLYGGLIGASEATLQYALGGIAKLGRGGLGKLPLVRKLVSALDGAFAKVIKNPQAMNALRRAGGILGSFASEGTEEYLQSVIDPIVRNVIFGEENKLNLLSEDKIYSFLLGGLMGGVFESANVMTGGAAYEAQLSAQRAETRAALEVDVQSLGLDQRTSERVIKAYDSLSEGQTGKAQRSINKLQGAVTHALEVRAEADADMNVARVQAQARLSPLYAAMEQAAQTGNVTAFQEAQAKYMAEFDVQQAKAEAAKVKAANQVEAANRAIRDTAAEIEENIAVAHAEEAVPEAAQGSGSPGGNNVTGPFEAGIMNAGGMENGREQASIQHGQGSVEGVDLSQTAGGEATGGPENGGSYVVASNEVSGEDETAFSRAKLKFQTIGALSEAELTDRASLSERQYYQLDAAKKLLGAKNIFYFRTDPEARLAGFRNERGLFLNATALEANNEEASFLLAHEWMHDHPRLLDILDRKLGELSDADIDRYVDARFGPVEPDTPMWVLEQRSEMLDNMEWLREEYLCDIVGSFVFDSTMGEKYPYKLGLSEEKFILVSEGFSEILQEGDYVEEAEGEEGDHARINYARFRRQADGTIKPSRTSEKVNSAIFLYNEGVNPIAAELSGKLDHSTSRILQNIYLANGQSVGGRLDMDTLNGILEGLDDAKDKSAIGYGRETFLRNLEDIAKTPEQGRRLVETYARPIQHAVAEMTRWQKAWAERIAKLKLNQEESAMVQLLGEGRIGPEELKKGLLFENGKPMDTAKIENAIRVFRQFYDEALKMANAALVRNGYERIPGREQYFPHFMEEQNRIKRFWNKVVKGKDQQLPTEISGRTDIFRPGKKWFRNFQHRYADSTDYDAVKGFMHYLDGVGQVIFLTDSTQRVRQLESAIRARYSMPDADSELKGRERAEHLNRFAAYLLEYGNQLAGKKAKLDRSLEEALGRKAFSWMDWLKKRFGANAVGGNLSTALSNFIPITQGLATMPKGDFLRGMQAAVSRQVRMDGLWERSDFLMSRFGKPDDLVTKRWDKVAQKGGQVLNFLFETVDRFTAETLVFGKYQEGLRNGLSEEAAMRAADEYAVRTMAGRSIGEVPTLMNAKTLGIFNQFQLEINNQISNIMKDIPRNAGGDKRKIAAALVQLFLYSWLYNELNEKLLTGRRPAFDPIHVATEAVEDFSTGKAGDAMVNLGRNVLDQLPLGQLLTGGGRIPLANALEGASPFDAIVKSMNGEDASDAWKNAGEGLLYNFLMPAMGGQIKKSIKGVQAVNQGGRQYGEKLAYPIEKTPGNFVSAVLFGPSAVKEGRAFYANGGKALSQSKTETYRALTEQGFTQQEAYALSGGLPTQSKGAKLGYIATFDHDGDGTPDLDKNEMNIVAAVLGIKDDKGNAVTDVPAYAKKQVNARIETIEAEEDLTEKEKAKKIEDENLRFFLTVLGK